MRDSAWIWRGKASSKMTRPRINLMYGTILGLYGAIIDSDRITERTKTICKQRESVLTRRLTLAASWHKLYVCVWTPIAGWPLTFFHFKKRICLIFVQFYIQIETRKARYSVYLKNKNKPFEMHRHGSHNLAFLSFSKHCMALCDLPFSTTLSSVRAGVPVTSGGFFTSQKKVPLSLNWAGLSCIETSLLLMSPMNCTLSWNSGCPRNPFPFV